MDAATSRALADLVLAAHVGFAAFVVCGLLAVLVGGALGWRWVRNPWLRAIHLAAIVVVVAEAWGGMACPLTTLETALRDRAGDPTYDGTFMAYWLRRLLYHEAPPWVFVTAYTIFAAAVAASWRLVAPHPFVQELSGRNAARKRPQAPSPDEAGGESGASYER